MTDKTQPKDMGIRMIRQLKATDPELAERAFIQAAIPGYVAAHKRYARELLTLGAEVMLPEPCTDPDCSRKDCVISPESQAIQQLGVALVQSLREIVGDMHAMQAFAYCFEHRPSADGEVHFEAVEADSLEDVIAKVFKRTPDKGPDGSVH